MLIHLLELGGLPAPAYPKAVGGGGGRMLFFIFVEVKFSLKLLSEGSCFLSPQNLGLTKVNHLQNFLLGSANILRPDNNVKERGGEERHI